MASRADRIAWGVPGTPGFAWRRLAFWFVLTLLALGLFGASFALAYSKMHERTALPGVQVAGIDIAGLSRAAAENEIRAALPVLSTGELTVQVGALEESIPYSEIERDYDMGYMLGEAFGQGRSGSILDQLTGQVALLRNGTTIDPVMTWNNEALAARVAALAAAAQVPVVDATVARDGAAFVATPASEGLAIDVPAVVEQAMAAVNNLSAADSDVVVAGTPIIPAVSTEAAQAAVDRAQVTIGAGLPVSGEELAATVDPAIVSGWIHLDEISVGEWQLTIERGAIEAYVLNYSREVLVPPTNASFALGGGNIDVIPSAPGRAVDVQPTSDSILAALQTRADGQGDSTAAISFVPVEPALTTEEARAIAPQVEKLSEWTTFYAPGPLNGDGVNIEIPTNVINGYVVEPGGTFDYLDAIGPVTSPPYESGGALVHGQIREDGAIGGGMCSTSTTLFNAALRFGLPITARDNHSLYISRYPVGLDATVWSTGGGNRQSMAFVNDTEYPLVIRGVNNTGAVTFQIWGVDDGRTVEFSEPRIANIIKPAFSELEYTNDLAPGRRVRVNDAYDAFDVWVTRTIRNAAGEVILEETYRSHYKQLPGYVRVGRSDGDPRHGRVVKVPVPNGGPQPDPARPEG